jgi:hypothetical protein
MFPIRIENWSLYSYPAENSFGKPKGQTLYVDNADPPRPPAG